MGRTDRRPTRTRRTARRPKRRGRRTYWPFGALRYKVAIALIGILVITGLIVTVLPPPDSVAAPDTVPTSTVLDPAGVPAPDQSR